MEFSFQGRKIAVNIPDQAELMAAVRERFRREEGFALATINLDHLVKLARSAPFLEAYAAHEMIVADGNPIVWLSKIARRPVALLPGSDLVIPLARLAAEEGVSVALIGSSEEALARSGARLESEAPGLRIAYRCAPAMGFDPASDAAAEILKELDASGAGLCFLALGAPKQEMLAARGRSLAPKAGFASIGAGLDFLSGHQTRAPEWVRKSKLEWFWRMASSPRRLIPRYAQCFAILPGQLAAALRLRRMGGGA